MLTIGLKSQVDLPVWEWMRFAPVASAAAAAMTTAGDGSARYIYYSNLATFHRYDTFADAWQTVQPPLVAALTVGAIQYKGYHGYHCRSCGALGAGSTARIPAITGQVLKGYKIRIISGTGVGQERTITAVAAPDIHDSGFLSAATALLLTDGLKAWAFNLYAGYQVRIVQGTGAGQVRKIRYNSATALTIRDDAWSLVEPYSWGCPFAVAPAANSYYQIESSVITVDTPWTTPPDGTSEFMVLSGSVLMMSSSAAAPFYTFQSYDVASDTWAYRGTAQNFFVAALGTDVSLERLGEYAGVYDSGTASAGGAATLTTDKTWAVNRYSGYRLRITGGTGLGQQRVVLSNTAGPNSIVTVSRNWHTLPDATSTYEIIADNDKFFAVGHNIAGIFTYSCEADAWSASRIYDWGHCRNMAVSRGTYNEGFALIALARSGSATVTATTIINHNLKVGDPITISGTVNYNGNWTVAAVTSATVFTYVSGTSDTSSGVAATVTSNTTNAVIVDATKSWTVNEHAGRLISLISGVGLNATNQTRRITSNTATALTINGVFGTVPTNGNFKYIIHDAKAFGWSLGSGQSVSGVTAGWGTATGTQSTTSLADTTKNWPVNYWVGKRVRFMSGTGAYQELPITASAATTLTFATATAPVNGETDYCIVEPALHGAGTQMLWVGANTDTATAGMYIYVFRGGASPLLDRLNLTTDRLDPIAYFPMIQGGLTTGSMCAYNGENNIYITKDATGWVYILDVNNLETSCAGIIPYAMGGAVIGNRMTFVQTVDNLRYLYIMRHTGTEFWRELVSGILE